jgi:hypothetical protein
MMGGGGWYIAAMSTKDMPGTQKAPRNNSKLLSRYLEQIPLMMKHLKNSIKLVRGWVTMTTRCMV